MTGLNRRRFSGATASLLAAASIFPRKAVASSPAEAEAAARFSAGLQALEGRSGGRLGVHVLDSASGAQYGQRSDERFLMCSTFKLMACARLLQAVDRGQESLQRRVRFGKADLIDWSPVTRMHTGGAGMRLGDLCAATLATSDNTAANLILASYGGPAALTAFAREIGDTVTRFDRTEPMLNEAVAGDERDTTSPRATAHSLRRVLLGDMLSMTSREQLLRWMRASETGERRLKAGLAPGWTMAGKTGTSGAGQTNDIAIVWPPQRAPLLITAYLAEPKVPAAAREATLAQVGALLAALAA